MEDQLSPEVLRRPGRPQRVEVASAATPPPVESVCYPIPVASVQFLHGVQFGGLVRTGINALHDKCKVTALSEAMLCVRMDSHPARRFLVPIPGNVKHMETY